MRIFEFTSIMGTYPDLNTRYLVWISIDRHPATPRHPIALP